MPGEARPAAAGRPPGPQPGSSGASWLFSGSVTSFELSSVVSTCSHICPRICPRPQRTGSHPSSRRGRPDGHEVARAQRADLMVSQTGSRCTPLRRLKMTLRFGPRGSWSGGGTRLAEVAVEPRRESAVDVEQWAEMRRMHFVGGCRQGRSPAGQGGIATRCVASSISAPAAVLRRRRGERPRDHPHGLPTNSGCWRRSPARPTTPSITSSWRSISTSGSAHAPGSLTPRPTTRPSRSRATAEAIVRWPPGSSTRHARLPRARDGGTRDAHLGPTPWPSKDAIGSCVRWPVTERFRSHRTGSSSRTPPG